MSLWARGLLDSGTHTCVGMREAELGRREGCTVPRSQQRTWPAQQGLGRPFRVGPAVARGLGLHPPTLPVIGCRDSAVSHQQGELMGVGEWEYDDTSVLEEDRDRASTARVNPLVPCSPVPPMW